MSLAAKAHADRRMVVLTEGHTNPITAKTAASVIRYCPEQVVGLFDSTVTGRTSQEVLGVGGAVPVIGSLDDTADANVLMIGIAPPGGKIPAAWRAIILDAISRKMDVVSGLHDFLEHDPEFSTAAAQHGVKLVDVRKNNEHDVANRQGIHESCLRIQTVGNDCCVGKMVASIEVTLALQELGHDARFVATGQTGILISGDGCPIDCVVSDFVSGAAEKLVLANQHHEIMMIEGQGSLAHPRYSAVTLGLLHGCLPHGLIMCYEAGRQSVNGMEYVSLTSLAHIKTVYETMANVMHPCRVIGVAVNTRLLDDAQAQQERVRVEQELGVPACDVFRHGCQPLVQAVLDLQMKVIS